MIPEEKPRRQTSRARRPAQRPRGRGRYSVSTTGNSVAYFSIAFIVHGFRNIHLFIRADSLLIAMLLLQSIRPPLHASWCTILTAVCFSYISMRSVPCLSRRLGKSTVIPVYSVCRRLLVCTGSTSFLSFSACEIVMKLPCNKQDDCRQYQERRYYFGMKKALTYIGVGTGAIISIRTEPSSSETRKRSAEREAQMGVPRWQRRVR